MIENQRERKRIKSSLRKFLVSVSFIVLLLSTQVKSADAFSGQDVRNFFGSIANVVFQGKTPSENSTIINAGKMPVKTVEGIAIDPDAFSSLQQQVSNLSLQFNSFNQTPGNVTSVIDTAGGNLLRNSSFEAGGVGSVPSQWNVQLDSNSGNTFSSAEGIHSGSLGLKFAGGGTGNFGISQPTTKTVPQRTYTLSAWVKVVNAPNATFRIGFWDEQNNREGSFKNINISGTRDWFRISTTVTTPGMITDSKNYFPMLEAQGLTSGAVYLDDVQLTEGSVLTDYNTAQASAGSNALSLGDGSILGSTGGDLYPAQSGVGQLGLSSNKWNSLNLNNANIDSNGNLSLSGSATVNGSAYVGSLTVNNNLILSSTQSAIPVRSGGTGITSTPTNGQLLIGNGTGYGLANLTAGSGVTITNSAGGITIATTGSGSTAFSGITGGTNTTAAMVVGTGASLTTSGTGTIGATSVTGLSVTSGKTLTASNSLTLAGTDATTMTFPSASDTVVGVSATQTLTSKTLTAPAINGTVTTTGLTLPAFTAGGNITGSGALTITSGGATALALDTGGAGAVNIGNTNATSLAFGNGTTNPTYTFSGSGTFSTSTGTNTLNGNTTIAANKTLTLSSGTGTITQNYSNTTGAATTFNVTNSNTGAGTSVNGLSVALVGTAPSSGTNVNTGINFANVTGVANNTFNALTFGTGYTNFVTSPNINVSSAGVITGAGSYNGVSLSSTTVQPVVAGPFTFQSNGANGVFLDTGGAGAVTIGGTNATSLVLGNVTTNPTFAFNGSGTFSTSTGTNTLNGNTTIAANKNLTLPSGTGQISQTYSNTAASNASAYNITNGNTTVTATNVNGLDLTLTNATNTNNSNTLNGVTFEAASNNNTNVINGLNFVSATGYTNFLKTPTAVLSSAGALSGLTGLTVASGGLTVTAGGLTVSAGGATVTGASSVNGNLTLGPATSHIISSQTTAPTVAIGAAAGTGAAPSLASATDTKGAVTVNVTTGTATGVLATVTFNTTYASAPIVVITPANAAAGALSTTIPFVGSTATTFTLNANGTAVPNGTYIWNYEVIQ